MPVIRFERKLIADERYESAAVFDVDNNGVLDILSGAYWYPARLRPQVQGRPRHALRRYFDEFGIIPMDIDGDGFTDFVSGGWFGQTLRWHRTPRATRRSRGPSTRSPRSAASRSCKPATLTATAGSRSCPTPRAARSASSSSSRDAKGRGTGEFRAYTITDVATGHGLGYGNVAGHGRTDLVYAGGWLEAPADPLTGKWTWHREFDLGSASCPVLVADVYRDGVNDLIVRPVARLRPRLVGAAHRGRQAHLDQAPH